MPFEGGVMGLALLEAHFLLTSQEEVECPRCGDGLDCVGYDGLCVLVGVLKACLSLRFLYSFMLEGEGSSTTHGTSLQIQYYQPTIVGRKEKKFQPPGSHTHTPTPSFPPSLPPSRSCKDETAGHSG